jgi:hypothetical protein
MLRAIVVYFLLSIPVLPDTLVSGSVYFDSQNTLAEVVKLSAAKDNESILKLINDGHVSQPTDTNKDIVVLTTGLTSESPAEFRFLNEPTTYWTLTKFVNKEAVVEPTPTPMPEQPTTLTATPEPIATATATPERMTRPTKKRHRRESENNDPTDDDHGQRIWHKVDGKWKWQPAHRKPVRKVLPSDQAPPALPAKP